MKKCFSALVLGLMVSGLAVQAGAQTIATDSARASDSKRYISVKSMKMIEFISNGVTNEALMAKHLQPSTIGLINASGLRWLQLRDTSIDSTEVVQDETGVSIPLTIGVRYMTTKNVVDGTLNVLLRVTQVNGEIKVEAVSYDDNADIQKIGRVLITDVNIANLANLIAVETVQSILSQPDQLNQLITLE